MKFKIIEIPTFKKIRFSYFIFFIIILLATNAFAQKKNHGIENKELVKKLKIADALLKDKSYYSASDYYLQVLQGAQQNEYVLFRLGHTYLLARDFVNAELHLAKIYEWKKEKALYPLSLYYYAVALKSNGKYPEAKKAFLLYTKTKSKETDEKYFRARVKNDITSCDFAMKMVEFDTINSVKIHPLAGKVNASYSDFSPVKLSDDSLLFASTRSDSVISVEYDFPEAHPVKLFLSTKDDTEWSEPSEYKDLNHPFDHTANGALSQDKKSFYFTRCRPNKKGEQICAIYKSELKNGNWSNPKKLNKGINQKKFSSTQPSLGSVIKGTGKKKKEYSVIYFVSNRPGGKGKTDIWYAQTNDKGEFGKAVNCGTKINTIGNEITPHYDSKSKKLFISSDYHPNVGGYDVFTTEGSLNKWSKVENAGLAINSSYDDTYYTSTANDSLKLLVSNRPGSIALKGATCCEDIFEIKISTPPTRIIAGMVKPENKSKGKFIESASVGIIPSGSVNFHQKKFNNIKSLKDSIQWIGRSDSTGAFSLETRKLKKYSLVFAKDSFDITILSLDSAIALSGPFDVLLKDLKDTSLLSFVKNEQVKPAIESAVPATEQAVKTFASIEKEEIAEGEVFLLDKVSFDTDKDAINKQTVVALDLLFKFLNSKPDLRVEIAGHTDNTGSDEHNQALSQRRANKIKDYLVKKGINKKRIQAIGYGESEPIAPNENPDGTDNPEGRKQNRRTEIRILEAEE